MVKPDKMFLFLVDINSIKDGTFITFEKKKKSNLKKLIYSDKKSKRRYNRIHFHGQLFFCIFKVA